MRSRARAAAGLLAVAVMAIPVPAAAHRPPRVSVVEPAAGTQITGTTVRITLAAGDGDAAASFRLLLDGAVVDIAGRTVRPTFTTHRLGPGESATLTVPLRRSGPHELVLRPDPDADSSAPTVTVRFTSRPARSPARALAVTAGLVAVVLLLALASARALRRQPRPAGPLPPPATG